MIGERYVENLGVLTESVDRVLHAHCGSVAVLFLTFLLCEIVSARKFDSLPRTWQIPPLRPFGTFVAMHQGDCYRVTRRNERVHGFS